MSGTDIRIQNGDCLDVLKRMDDNSMDAVVTDPPYGYSFMNKNWDRAVVGVETWRECLRVLKPGSFACVMSSPRQDVLARMIVNLQEVGFRTDFTSLYYSYASGFPKAANISKLVDKRRDRNPDYDKSIATYLREKRREKGLSLSQVSNYLGTVKAQNHYESTTRHDNRLPIMENYLKLKTLLNLDDRFDKLIEREEAEREIIGNGMAGLGKNRPAHEGGFKPDYDVTISATEQAKALDGSYAGFQPKPAVEVVLMVMKPLDEKTFVDQALANGKGITWLDSGRIPFQDDKDCYSEHVSDTLATEKYFTKGERHKFIQTPNNKGRFPANLLVSDDVLNDGRVTKSNSGGIRKAGSEFGQFSGWNSHKNIDTLKNTINDSGSYSRYFDLDAWSKVNLPVVFSGDISNSNNTLHTFSELLVWLFDHIQSKRLSPLGKGLYDALPSQIHELSSYTALLDNRLHITLNHDVPVAEGIFYRLLSQSVHNSLHNSLVANGVLDVQTSTLLLSSLDGCPFYHRLYDELLGQVSNLYPVFLLLLIGVAEQNQSCLIGQNQGDRYGDIYHQRLSYSYVIGYYKLLNLIYSLTQTKETTFPFIITPKPSTRERNMGLDKWINLETNEEQQQIKNTHATVKPIKLFSYLISLISRPGDIVLDPFIGSGTTAIAAKMLGRSCVGIELNKEYCEIARERIGSMPDPFGEGLQSGARPRPGPIQPQVKANSNGSANTPTVTGNHRMKQTTLF